MMRLFDSKHDFTTSLKRALSEIDPNWMQYNGLIVPGAHVPFEVEEKIEAIRKAREDGTPTLCVCFGHQLAAIEYARSVLGIKDATSEEFGEGTFVVKKRPEGLVVGQYGGESYWSYYDVAIKTEYPTHFITVPYHPEYQSSKKKPHPLLVQFMYLCQR